jgi:hypothetical protein
VALLKKFFKVKMQFNGDNSIHFRFNILIKKTNIFCGLIFVQMIIIFALLLSGCTNKTVDENKFVKIYAEMIIAQDTADYAPNNFKSIQDTIFKRYGVTRVEYNATVDSYNKDPQKWENFFDKAIAYVQTLKKQIQPGQSVKTK